MVEVAPEGRRSPGIIIFIDSCICMGLVLDPPYIFPLMLEKNLGGIIVGVEEESREHQPSGVVNEDAS